MNAASTRLDPAISRQPRTIAASVMHFLWRFAELQVAMVLGALACYLVGGAIPASFSVAAVYYPGSYLYAIGDLFFLTVPVVLWMLFRHHGRRESLKMALAMLAPVAAIIVVGELGGFAYLRWLITAAIRR